MNLDRYLYPDQVGEHYPAIDQAQKTEFLSRIRLLGVIKCHDEIFDVVYTTSPDKTFDWVAWEAPGNKLIVDAGEFNKLVNKRT